MRLVLSVPLLAACLALGVGPAFAQGAPPAGSGKAPATKPDKGKGDKPKDEKKPAEAEFATEVMVIHATNSGKGIDPRIGNMPELKKPPFSSYDSYELLSKTRLPLSKDEKTMNLPNKRVLKTKLIEVLPDNEHVKMSASINQPGGKTFLPLLEVKAKANQTFIVAGSNHKGGILVLVFRVVK
jgi:hypothetical protein